MLVLELKKDGRIHIGKDVVIKVIRIGNTCKFGVDAPKDLIIGRDKPKERK